ncbi:MAG: ester cyclase [Caldilineaceae bacterium]
MVSSFLWSDLVLTYRITSFSFSSYFLYGSEMLSAKSLIQQILTQACNQGDLSVMNELIATEGSIRTASGEEPVSRMDLRQLVAAFRTAFPDLHCTVEDEISMGDKVAAYWTMRHPSRTVSG